MDGRLTVYRGIDTKKIVGAQVKGLSTWICRILREWPGMKLVVRSHDNQIALGLLFFFESMKFEDQKLHTVYQELSEVGKDWLVQAEDFGVYESHQVCEPT